MNNLKATHAPIKMMLSDLSKVSLPPMYQGFIDGLKYKQELTLLNVKTLVKVWQETTGIQDNPMMPVRKLAGVDENKKGR